MTMLEARNKFKLRSLTVDCRAEDADIDVDFDAGQARPGSAKSWPTAAIEPEKCIYM